MISNTQLPEARRKRLIAKLSGQMGGRGVPLPGAVGGEGRPFRSVGGFRPPRPHVTQGSHVLASVLAKLGIGGAGSFDEVSPGAGMAIGAPARPGMISDSFGGSPIPVPGGAPVPPPPPLSPIPSAAPAAGPLGGAPTATPTGQGGMISPTGPVGPIGMSAEGVLGGSPSLVPLGNGLFYDPANDQVVGSSFGGAGIAARQV